MTYRRTTYRKTSHTGGAVMRADGRRANSYDAGCTVCGHTVPKGTGILTGGNRLDGWTVTHAPQRLVSHFPQEVKYAGGCEEARETQPLWAAKTSGPARDRTRYGYGRCEDAPCCGCCD
jgi:hypothetical protein